MRRIVTAVLTLSLAFSFLLATTETANANATAGGGYSSSYAGESVFTNKAAGETGQFSAIFFNDGTQTWSAGVVGLLICLSDKTTCNVASPNAAYATGWFSTTVYATVSATVAPGQNGFFIYNFTVPAGTAPGTAATFNGDVGLIATGTELRPEGYFQINTTPAVSGALTISPTSAALPVGGTQQFTVTGAPSGQTVSFSVNGGCGAITTSGLFAATATNSPTQPCSVVASSGGLTATATIVVFGPATTMACTANPTSMATGGNLSTVKATLLDTNGNVVSNDNSTAVVFTNNTPTLVSYSGSTPNQSTELGIVVTANQRARVTVNGVASVNVLSNTSALTGTAVISASDNTNSSVTGCSQQITITGPGAAAKLVNSFWLSTISADGVSTSVLEVDETDTAGNIVETDNSTTVTISRDTGASVCGTSTNGTAGSAGPTTLSSGSAFFTITATTTPGTCAWSSTANTTGITSGTATLTTVLSGAPNKLVIAAQASAKAADGVATLRVTVALQDASGNPVTTPASQVAVTATLGNGCSGTNAVGTYDSVKVQANPTVRSTGASGAFFTLTSAGVMSGTPTTTTGTQAPNGDTGTGSTNLARFVFKSTFATTGCTVTFSDGTNITSATAVVVFVSGGAAKVGCVFSPNQIVADGSSTSIATVSMTDLNGNLATSGTFSVTFTRTSGGTASTTLLTSSPQTTSGGVAQFTVRSASSGTTGTDTYTPATTINGTATSTTSTPATASSCSISVQTTIP